jgi:hypothetical protein
VTFGGDMPQRPGDFGIEVVSGMAWLVRAHGGRRNPKRGRKLCRGAELHIQRLMPADALRIRGRHNAVQRPGRTGAGAGRRVARWRPCCTACANTAASRTAWSRWAW